MARKIKDLLTVPISKDTKIPCSGGATTLEAIVPTGVIQMYAGAAAPTGWAMCDGAIVPIAAHPSLFAVIGNAYGGDGVSDFALPDLRNRFPMGVGGSRGRGSVGGSENVTLAAGQMPSHTHGLNSQATITNTGNVSIPVNTDGGSGMSSNPSQILSADGSSALFTNEAPNALYGGAAIPVQGMAITISGEIQTTGNGDAIDVLNPFLALNFIIRL